MPDSFTELVKWFGIPGALLAVMVWSLIKGTVVPRWFLAQYQQQQAALTSLKDAQIHERDEALAAFKIEMSERMSNLREEKNYWREMALHGSKELEKATKTIEKAVEKLPRAVQSPPDGGEG